jgi:hypothetical protein
MRLAAGISKERADCVGQVICNTLQEEYGMDESYRVVLDE